jgi:hypothetical protein
LEQRNGAYLFIQTNTIHSQYVKCTS